MPNTMLSSLKVVSIRILARIKILWEIQHRDFEGKTWGASIEGTHRNMVVPRA